MHGQPAGQGCAGQSYIRTVLTLALANRTLVFVYKIGLLEGWGFGGLVIFHDE